MSKDTLSLSRKFKNLSLHQIHAGDFLLNQVNVEEFNKIIEFDLLGNFLTPKSLRSLQSQKSLVMVLTGT